MRLVYLILALLVIGCAGTEEDFRGPYGELVLFGDTVVDPDEYAAEVERTVAAWEPLLGECVTDSLDGLVVLWYSGPFPGAYGSVLAGRFDAGGRRWAPWQGVPTVHVALLPSRGDGVRVTALAHELGHAILHGCGLPYSEYDLLEWRANYEIPY